MNRFLSRCLDRIAVYYAAARMPSPDGRDLHFGEAEQMLRDLDFHREPAAAAKLEFSGPVKFHFASPRPTPYSVNNTVQGRLYRCRENWQDKPVVVMLHGWNDSLNHHHYFPLHARRLNATGFNAATMQLPWQFDRRPRELGLWGNFLTADVRRTVEGVLQALVDIQALLGWMREQGSPFVGLWGISLGGWLTGLCTCADARIGAAVLEVPMVRPDRLIQEARFCRTIKRVLEKNPLDLRNLSLVSHKPMIDKSRLLLIEAEHDFFVPRETIEELWKAWERPEIWRCPSGHISILYVPDLAERIVQWFATKAAAPAVK